MIEKSLSELLKGDFSIFSVSAVEQYWKNGNLNLHHESGREEHVISYTVDGKREIRKKRNAKPLFTAEPGDVVFISQGASYISETITENEASGHTLCIKFKIKDLNGEDILIKDKYLLFHDDKSSSLLKLFHFVFNNYVSLYQNNFSVKSALCEILSETLGRTPGDEKNIEFKQILPAIKYIKENPGENASVKELADMCFLSESYFRTKFKEFSGGISPVDWRNMLRVEKAKQLLGSSLWNTELIASTLGFYDTSHFYKIYKKITGELPRGKNEK